MSVVCECVLSLNWTAYILQDDKRSLQYQASGTLTNYRVCIQRELGVVFLHLLRCSNVISWKTFPLVAFLQPPSLTLCPLPTLTVVCDTCNRSASSFIRHGLAPTDELNTLYRDKYRSRTHVRLLNNKPHVDKIILALKTNRISVTSCQTV